MRGLWRRLTGREGPASARVEFMRAREGIVTLIPRMLSIDARGTERLLVHLLNSARVERGAQVFTYQEELLTRAAQRNLGAVALMDEVTQRSVRGILARLEVPDVDGALRAVTEILSDAFGEGGSVADRLPAAIAQAALAQGVSAGAVEALSGPRVGVGG